MIREKFWFVIERYKTSVIRYLWTFQTFYGIQHSDKRVNESNIDKLDEMSVSEKSK